MTHHIILAILLVLIACAYLRAVIGLIAYRRQAAFNLVDSDYRASALVANAKREFRVSRCYLYTTRPDGRLGAVISAPLDGWRESTAQDLLDAEAVL